ncbi:MAG: helix-turn-helix domain-containing protein [Planctomycetaceae bacterium]|jgi:IS30 family transposase|nr:helix-turn-helix domain-containing protein [Planctomycetaceae bacterium]
MPYHQLTLEKREVTSQMHYSGARASAIAERLRRSPSTIGRELRRNEDSSGYRAVAAQEQTTRRRRNRPLIRKMDDPFINESVRTGLSQEWSPE